MPEFKNLQEIAEYFKKEKSNYLTLSPKFKAILDNEKWRLVRLIQAEIIAWYQYYSPEVYKRTYKWIDSLRFTDFTNEKGQYVAKIYFDDALAYHPSVMKGGEAGYVPWLMEVGWHWHRPHKVVPMFTDFEDSTYGTNGVQYVRKAVEKYNRTNPFELKVEVYHGDRRYI